MGKVLLLIKKCKLNIFTNMVAGFLFLSSPTTSDKLPLCWASSGFPPVRWAQGDPPQRP